MNIDPSIIVNVNTEANVAYFNTFLNTLKFNPRSTSHKSITLDPTAQIVSILEGMSYRLKYKITSPEAVYLFDLNSWRIWNPQHVIIIDMRYGCTLSVISDNLYADEILNDLINKLEKYLIKNTHEDGVWADFTYMNSDGMQRHRQFLKCPEWSTINNNYTHQTQLALNKIISMKSPWERGSLMIWNGEPGTGKTFAVRSLMMSWRDRFNFAIIVDPEHLAADPGYYFSVANVSTEMPIAQTVNLTNKATKRTLFIMEDCADLIMPESRSVHFDKVGKLLNITDGLFGQGREDVFLLTFNEKIDRIDSAFTRPGRCIDKIEFGKFSADEAQKWVSSQDLQIDKPIGRSEEFTIAELYAKRKC